MNKLGWKINSVYSDPKSLYTYIGFNSTICCRSKIADTGPLSRSYYKFHAEGYDSKVCGSILLLTHYDSKFCGSILLLTHYDSKVCGSILLLTHYDSKVCGSILLLTRYDRSVAVYSYWHILTVRSLAVYCYWHIMTGLWQYTVTDTFRQ